MKLSKFSRIYTSADNIYYYSLSRISRDNKHFYGLEYNCSNRSYDDCDEEGYCEESLSTIYSEDVILNKLSIRKSYNRHKLGFMAKVGTNKRVRKLSKIGGNYYYE